jgi:hypothetical protein
MKLPCTYNTQQKMIKYWYIKALRIFLHGSSRAGLGQGLVGVSNKISNI